MYKTSDISSKNRGKDAIMNKEEFLKKYKMKEISEIDGFEIEIIYATPNNFMKEVLYDKPICMLRAKTAEKLKKANNKLKKYGLKIKIWDSFRPYKYQEKMWSIYPDEKYVANPYEEKCSHCTGRAVDITLCTMDNKEVEMPTEFDHFGIESYRENYKNLNEDTRYRVQLLENIMKKSGFIPYPYEWWHFDDEDDYDTIYDMYI